MLWPCYCPQGGSHIREATADIREAHVRVSMDRNLMIRGLTKYVALCCRSECSHIREAPVDIHEDGPGSRGQKYRRSHHRYPWRGYLQNLRIILQHPQPRVGQT